MGKLYLNGKEVSADIVMTGTWTALGTVTLPTGIKLVAPDISGVVTAASALTIPAHTSGTITIGANKIVTTRASLYDVSSTQLGVRNADNTQWWNFKCCTLYATLGMEVEGGAINMQARTIQNVGQIQIAQTVGIPIVTTKTVKVSVAHNGTLFDAAALTDSATIWQQPAGTVLRAVKLRLKTQFAATDMTDLDVILGDAGDNDGLVLHAMNLISDGAGSEYKTRGAYWDTSAKGSFWYSHAAKDWIAYATAVGANLNTTSAGELDFYFVYDEL